MFQLYEAKFSVQYQEGLYQKDTALLHYPTLITLINTYPVSSVRKQQASLVDLTIFKHRSSPLFSKVFYSILFNDSIIFILFTFLLSSKLDRMVSNNARIIETNIVKIFNLSGIC